MNMKAFLKSGHSPTLFSSFLYFDFCFAVWALNGAMAPFISEQFGLSPSQKGWMISVPIISGALLRFPLGILAQQIGRKSAAMIEMGMITAALFYGWFFVNSYSEVLFMGVLLGIAGASFGVALSLGSGWYPAEYKGLVMGIVGLGNSGTILATLFAPPLAGKFGLKAVYGFSLIPMALAILILLIFAKEPPDREQKKLKDYLKVLTEKDSWVLNMIYVVTFGGFIGLANFLPTFFHEQFAITKIKSGQFTALVVIIGSVARVVGGYLSDLWGGIRVLKVIFLVLFIGVLLSSLLPTLYLATALLLLIFAALGIGNGSVFQLVPFRFPTVTAVASSMVGEIGALGGAIIPNAMGLSKQFTGNFAFGFITFAVVIVIAHIFLRKMEKEWVGEWIDSTGKFLSFQSQTAARVQMAPAMEIY
ncbi:MAG: NarK/NasA family nitrate transporter [Elusimicrobia bacterium]|nr:NarK/NasA family nitrate transporter [Elusimicrobiota bacterium]